MNLDDLTKTQMVLLVILLSFVTSIATGITTVALLEQVPPTITSSVSRVIQNTVEKTIETGGGKQTVIVKEDDLIVDAIAENQKSLVLVRENVGGTPGVTLASGFVVSKDGLVVTDSARIWGYTQLAVSIGTETYPAEVAVYDPAGFSLLRIKQATDTAGGFKSFAPVTFTEPSVRPGQTIIAVGLAETGALRIAKGIVARADLTESSAVSFSSGVPAAGSILIDTSGEAVGISLGLSEARASAAGQIVAAIAGLPKS